MKYDFIIIGSGIIGLTLAFKLKKKHTNSKILILDKERDSIQHGSGRNSGVIHSGIYYNPGSLRATLGVRGGIELKEYIKSKKLWIDECGKLLIPTSENSFHNTDNLFQRGIDNGVVVKKLSGEEVKNLEPNINTKYNIGLLIPFTSVADPKEVSKSLLFDLQQMGVDIFYNEQVTKIEDEGTIVYTELKKYSCEHSFNCSGLQSDIIAKSAGLEFRYSFLPFKGKYWKITDPNFKLKHLVYPIPDLQYPFLGLHSSHKRDGTFYIGPSSTPVFGREHYHWNDKLKFTEAISLAFSFAFKILKNENKLRSLAIQEARLLTKNGFANEMKKLLNNISSDNIKASLEKIGIRSQIFDPLSKTLVNDFVVINQKHATHVLNAISPAWTASFAFADHIIDLAKI
jgi:(S)-2-hydroxyglutarate dehydrogenase